MAMMVTGYVPGPCASVGVQLKAPVEAPIVAPVAAGVPSVSDQVIVFAGTSPSVAVTVKVNAANSFVVSLAGLVTTGAEFTSFTVIENLFEPTTMLIASKSFLAALPSPLSPAVAPEASVSVGVQLKAPVEPLIVAPAGAPASNENVSVFAGTSPSVAVAVKVTGVPTVPVLFPIAARTGAWFTSFTVIVIAADPLSTGDPLSVAVTVTGYTPGPCASVGVQLKAPVEELIVAPVAAGLPNVSDHVCTSPEFGSVAVTVKANAASSFVVLFPGFVTTGGWLFDPTTMLIASKSFIAGLPLFVPPFVTGCLPLA